MHSFNLLLLVLQLCNFNLTLLNYIDCNFPHFTSLLIALSGYIRGNISRIENYVIRHETKKSRNHSKTDMLNLKFSIWNRILSNRTLLQEALIYCKWDQFSRMMTIMFCLRFEWNLNGLPNINYSGNSNIYKNLESNTQDVTLDITSSITGSNNFNSFVISNWYNLLNKFEFFFIGRNFCIFELFDAKITTRNSRISCYWA